MELAVECDLDMDDVALLEMAQKVIVEAVRKVVVKVLVQ